MSKWERSIDFVLAQEGGYNNNPADPGGETNWGISKRAYPNENIKTLTRERAVAIYFQDYWKVSGADNMPWPMCLAHFDLAVNGGPGRAAEALKAVGPNFDAYMAWRLAWYKRLNNWPTFGRGWENRVNALIAESKIPFEETETMAERISDGAKHLNIFIERGTPKNGKVYRVKDIFTTLNGSWEPSGRSFSIPQWARDAYLRPWGAPDYFDDAGADHHMLGGIYDESTQRMKNGAVIHYFTHTDNGNHVDTPVKEKSGWANVTMFNKFSPGNGERGAWSWYPKSDIPADKVVGGGMPDGWHVSIFATWVLSDGTDTPPVEPPTDPGVDPRIALLEAWARKISAQYPQGPQYE